MTSSLKVSVVAASAAAVLGVLLLGTPGSFASLSSTVSGTPLVITSGTITASVSGPTFASVSTGPAPAGVVVNTGSLGIIPGIQDETLTYSVTNSSTSASPAAVSSIEVVSSGIVNAAAWADIQPYLTATVKVNGGAAIALPATAFTATGIDGTIASTVNLQPGATVPVVVEFSIPATASSGTIDLLRTLQADRSASTSIASIITVAPVFTLTQTPRAAP
jgi:hypothetical protein